MIVTDLDGTLWSDDGYLHPDTTRALELLRQSEVKVIVATGRRRRSAARVLRAHGLTLDGIVLDGAVASSPLRGEPFFRCPFSSRALDTMIDVLGNHGLEPIFHLDGPLLDVLTGTNPSVPASFLPSRVRVAANLRVPMVGPIYGADVFLSRRVAETVVSELVTRAVGSPWIFANRRDVPEIGLRIRPIGATKSAAVTAYREYIAPDIQRVIAIGNAPNDAELLATADIAVCVGDGCEELRRLAHVVAPPAALGGWALVTELL